MHTNHSFLCSMRSLKSQCTFELFAHPWDWTLAKEMRTCALLFLVRLWAAIIFWDLESFLSFETLSYCYLVRPCVITSSLAPAMTQQTPTHPQGIGKFYLFASWALPQSTTARITSFDQKLAAHYRRQSPDTSSLISNVLQPLEVLYACPASDCKKTKFVQI